MGKLSCRWTGGWSRWREADPATVPVASREASELIEPLVDDWVALWVPEVFRAVGEGYADFPQTPDAEVVRLLAAARADHPG